VGGEQRLVAYVVARAGHEVPEQSVLRAKLLETLPEFMAPQSYVVMESLPLTPNGKLDRRRGLAALLRDATARKFDVVVVVDIDRLTRSEDLIQNLVDLEAEFWGMVKMNQAPEPDCNHKTTRELLKKLYPNTNGEVLDLADLAADHEHLREAKAQIKELEGVERFHTNRILATMGESAVGLLPDGTGYTRSWRNPYTRAASEVEGGFVLKFSKSPKGVK
jgi:hypothetical protein